jgi:hypothetical protein
MQPDQQNNQAQHSSSLPQYDFIMNPATQQKKSKFSLPSGNSTKQRIFIVAGGLGVLLLVGFAAMAIFGGGSNSKDNLTILAQQQNEIIRITEAAKDEKAIRDTSTQHTIATIALVVQSEQQQTIALLPKKPNAKTLALKKNAKTDAVLVAATQNNTYDETLLNTLQTQLVAYQDQIKKTFDATKSSKEKDVLNSAYKSVGVLLSIPTK